MSGFLPGFLWQVRIKAKVAEFTQSPRKLRRSFQRQGVARGQSSFIIFVSDFMHKDYVCGRFKAHS